MFSVSIETREQHAPVNADVGIKTAGPEVLDTGASVQASPTRAEEAVERFMTYIGNHPPPEGVTTNPCLSPFSTPTKPPHTKPPHTNQKFILARTPP